MLFFHPLTLGQILSAALVFGTLFYLEAFAKKRHHPPPPPPPPITPPTPSRGDDHQTTVTVVTK
jgi:hypothetical protein